MESHSFKTQREVSVDDNRFKPFTGELPSRLQMLAERALARYEKMEPALRKHFEPALVSVNTAVFRTVHKLDTENNHPNLAANDDQFDSKDAFLRPKFAA